MFKILSTYICWKNIYKMQHPEVSGTPVLYIGRTEKKKKRKTNVFVLTEAPICVDSGTAVGCKLSWRPATLFNCFMWIAVSPSGHTVANADRDKRGSYPPAKVSVRWEGSPREWMGDIIPLPRFVCCSVEHGGNHERGCWGWRQGCGGGGWIA
jgi:hypothetical protein